MSGEEPAGAPLSRWVTHQVTSAHSWEPEASLEGRQKRSQPHLDYISLLLKAKAGTPHLTQFPTLELPGTQGGIPATPPPQGTPCKHQKEEAE